MPSMDDPVPDLGYGGEAVHEVGALEALIWVLQRADKLAALEGQDRVRFANLHPLGSLKVSFCRDGDGNLMLNLTGLSS